MVVSGFSFHIASAITCDAIRNLATFLNPLGAFSCSVGEDAWSLVAVPGTTGRTCGSFGFRGIVLRPAVFGPARREPEFRQLNRATLTPFLKGPPFDDCPFQQLAVVVRAVDTGIDTIQPVADMELCFEGVVASILL